MKELSDSIATAIMNKLNDHKLINWSNTNEPGKLIDELVDIVEKIIKDKFKNVYDYLSFIGNIVHNMHSLELNGNFMCCDSPLCVSIRKSYLELKNEQ